VDEVEGVSDTLLKGSDRFTKSLSADKHVAGFGDLELIPVLTKEGTVGVEGINGVFQVRDSGVGGRRGLIFTVVKMADVGVVVMVVEVVVVKGVLLGLRSDGNTSQEGDSEYFHSVKFSFIMVDNSKLVI
jgi:hypothetical protein